MLALVLISIEVIRHNQKHGTGFGIQSGEIDLERFLDGHRLNPPAA